MFPRLRHRTAACFIIGLVFGYQMATNKEAFFENGALSYADRVNGFDDVGTPIVDVGSNGSRHDGSDWKAGNLDVGNITDVIRFSDLQQHKADDDTIARGLYQSVRILCWVMTSPSNLQKRASHVRETWGRRCNVLLFMSDAEDPDFPAIGLNVKPGRLHLYTKTMLAFDHVYQHHLNDADWFLKADDDTYVILENLRYLLSANSPDDPVYFGHHFQMFMEQGYFSGGAGYVLSREALRRYGSRTMNACVRNNGAEDLLFGFCMERLGVKAGNSRDRLNRSRFHSLNIRNHIQGIYPEWYKKFDNYSGHKGVESISDYPISFHYVCPDDMYTLEYFTYHASVYGLMRGLQQLNPDDNSTSDHH